MNIAQHVERGSVLFPDHAALCTDDAIWTYSELDEISGRFAAHLASTGVAAGSRIALRLPNTAAFVVAFLGALKLGAVVIPLSTRIAPDEVRHILADCDPDLLISTSELRTGKPEENGQSRELILPPDGRKSDFIATLENRTKVRAQDCDPDSPSMIIYTSGTSGRPKGAVLTHRNVVSNMNSKVRYTELSPDDRVLLFLPLYHCYGLNAVLNAAFNACATVVLRAGFDLRRSVETIRKEKITAFFSVPSVYRLLLDANVSPTDLAGVRYFMSAGAPLPLTTQNAWNDRFAKVINEGYGLTETSPFACYNHEFRHKAGSVGSPIENVEVRVIDPDSGTPLEDGEIGEIVVRGPNVMQGYWNAPEATATAIVDGWFRTGDMGLVDDEGYVFLVDRRTDLLIVDGQNVYPSEVERVLMEHPDVIDAVVYSKRHEVVGDIVCAGFVARAGTSPSAPQLRKFCATRLAPFKIPSVLTALDEVPRNATGKPLRRSLSTETA